MVYAPVAWLIHLLTASGAVLGLFSMTAVFANDYRTAFIWLFAAAGVDAVDGMLARAFNVSAQLPWIDGARLDDIVDYITYVFVPALMVWRLSLVPVGLALPVAAAILLASAYGFSRSDSKTTDYMFTGFPSLWNIVVFYLALLALPTLINAVVLLLLVGLVFVPVHYVYPSRTPIWRMFTLTLGTAWSGVVIAMAWYFPDVSQAVVLISLVYPAYYLGLSLVLELQRRRLPRSVV
jgi:phosphatidylcholine synthase